MRTNRSAGRKIDSNGLSPFANKSVSGGMPLKLGPSGLNNKIIGGALHHKSQVKSAERSLEHPQHHPSMNKVVKHVAEVAKAQQ